MIDLVEPLPLFSFRAMGFLHALISFVNLTLPHKDLPLRALDWFANIFLRLLILTLLNAARAVAFIYANWVLSLLPYLLSLGRLM